MISALDKTTSVHTLRSAYYQRTLHIPPLNPYSFVRTLFIKFKQITFQSSYAEDIMFHKFTRMNF